MFYIPEAFSRCQTGSNFSDSLVFYIHMHFEFEGDGNCDRVLKQV